ncbi:hypothetical protein KEM56_006741 [Ascosphaera pollenicola]|nr:hypothetical protein KEM56_006741 [Ascosphaera pollenicola]
MSTSNDPAEGHDHEHKEIDTHLAEVITPETTRAGVRPVRIAFEGCGHGMLDDIYTAIKAKSEHRGWSDGVDLVIIGGDFQAVRNPADLTCLSVPERYRALGDFPAYYAGEKKAPYLTMFVGGNHEASNYMQELYYGGWVAPNIYYLGAANVVRFAGLRIAGLSGIFAAYDYAKHHFERLPYNNNDQKSVYHTRQIDVRKLMQLQNQVDIVVSHDWPQGIENFGDTAKLFRHKRDFQRDSESGRLGSPAAKDLLNKLRPRLWLAAHLHVRFEAQVTHTEYSPLAVFVPHAAINAQRKALAAESASHAESDRSAWLEKVKEAADKAKEIEKQNATEPAAAADTNAQTTVVEKVEIEVDPAEEEKNKAEKAEKISAWNNFHSVADEQDAALVKDAQGESEIEDDKNYQVTWRKIEASEDGMSRVDAGVEKFEISRPKAPIATEGAGTEAKNPDEIDLDSSDVDNSDRKDGVKLESTEPVTSEDAVKPADVPEAVPTTTATATTTNPDEIDLDADDEEMGEQDNAVAAPIPAQPEVIAQSAADTGVETESTPAAKNNPDEIDIDLDMEDADTTEVAATTDTAVSSTLTIRPPVAAAEARQNLRSIRLKSPELMGLS